MLKLYLVLLTCAALVSPAFGTPVKFTWESEVDTVVPATPIPGVSFGDDVTVEIIVDNGGSSLNSQTWLGSHIQSAQLSVGSYSATFVGGFIPVGAQPVFQTNASGELTSVLFVGTGPSTINFDDFGIGGSIRLLNNSVKSSAGGDAYFVDRFVGPNPDDLIGWDQTPDIVPEPGTALLLCGLAVISFRRLRS
jgi:hypothetical protein